VLERGKFCQPPRFTAQDLAKPFVRSQIQRGIIAPLAIPVTTRAVQYFWNDYLSVWIVWEEERAVLESSAVDLG